MVEMREVVRGAQADQAMVSWAQIAWVALMVRLKMIVRG